MALQAQRAQGMTYADGSQKSHVALAHTTSFLSMVAG